MLHLLAPRGALVGLFYLGDERGGPPFALNEKDHDKLFRGRFLLANDLAVPDEHPLFGANERWREYRRAR
jgi:thiopurine S-methyltransferase